MTIIKKFIFATLYFSLTFVCQAETAIPSSESIQELIAVTDSKKIIDNMGAGLEGMMNTSMQQTLQGKPISPEQEAILAKMKTKIVTLMKEEISWSKLEPVTIQIYKESFSQEEVDGMLTFYKSSAGQAVIKKMPVVMQKSMSLMQTNMSTIIPKMQKIQEETLVELKACK